MAENPTSVVQAREVPEGNEGKHTKTNWLNRLMYIGLGVSIFVLIILVFKLIGDTMEDVTGDITGESDLQYNVLDDSNISKTKSRYKKTKTKDNLHIVPYLFDEPLVLFERNTNASQIDSINTSITELNKKISTIKNINKKCDKYNDDIMILSESYLNNLNTEKQLDKYDLFYEDFKKVSNICIMDEYCKLNSKEGIIFPEQCKNKLNEDEDDNNCMEKYFKNYLTDTKPACALKNCNGTEDPNNSGDSIVKYGNLPEPFDKNIDTIFQTVYSNYIDNENYADIKKELKNYKVCISKIKNEELDKLEKQLKNKTTEKNKHTEDSSFYQILFG
jgi:hypothetical protein